MLGPAVDRPILMLVTDRQRVGGLAPLVDAIALAVDAGVDAVQVREKDLLAHVLRSFLVDLSSAVGERAAIIVNGDIQAALAAGVGIHLPDAAPPLTSDEASGLAPAAWLGRSLHDASHALNESLSYVIFGHVFPSGSKPGLPPRGLDYLQRVASMTTRPVLAIGGITAENSGDALAHGAAGVAVIGAILDAPDIGGATRELRAAIDRAATDKRGMS